VTQSMRPCIVEQVSQRPARVYLNLLLIDLQPLPL